MADIIGNGSEWKRKSARMILWGVLILWFYMISSLIIRRLCGYSSYFFGAKSLTSSSIMIISHIVILLFSVLMMIKGYSFLKVKKDSLLLVYVMVMVISSFFILFVARHLFVVYSEKPIEEIAFLKNVIADINEQQIKNEKIENLAFEYKNEIKRCQFINEVYPIYCSTSYNNNIVENYLKKAFNENAEIEIRYYGNSKIINSIVIDGKEYKDIEQFMIDYHKYLNDVQKEKRFITAVEN